MISFLADLFPQFSPTIVPAGVCVLPAPQESRKRPDAPKVKREGVFTINEETRTFGFRDEKEAAREGAVSTLTGYDLSVLRQRSLWGGKKVQSQNATAKVAWHNGETVGECARSLGLSESWVEKRFAAFSAALSDEREG